VCYKIRRKFSASNLDRQGGRNQHLPSAGARTTTVFFSYKKSLRKIRTSARRFGAAYLNRRFARQCKRMKQRLCPGDTAKRWPGGIRVGRRLFCRHCICANDLRQNAAVFSSISQRALQQRRRNLPKAASFPAKRNDGKKPLALFSPLPKKAMVLAFVRIWAGKKRYGCGGVWAGVFL